MLYGMIGLLGAKIWKENNVDLGNPANPPLPLHLRVDDPGTMISVGEPRMHEIEDEPGGIHRRDPDST